MYFKTHLSFTLSKQYSTLRLTILALTAFEKLMNVYVAQITGFLSRYFVIFYFPPFYICIYMHNIHDHNDISY